MAKNATKLKNALGMYTAFHVLFGVWMPTFWYISSCREQYRQSSFEFLDLPPGAMILGVLIVGGCFTATMGLIFSADLFSRRVEE